MDVAHEAPAAAAPYMIGCATADGWACAVILRDGREKVIGPWRTRQPGAHWSVMEAVERVVGANLADLDAPREVFVAQTSVVSVCKRTDPDDGFAGLRLRLAEGRFTVQHGPEPRPACLARAMEIVREFTARAEV